MIYYLFFDNRCVYEIYFAVKNGVKVRLAPHISVSDLHHGHTEKDICVHQANKRVESENAYTSMNSDVIAIRERNQRF